MRIAGYIPDDLLKITVFQYEGKFSVQFETPNYVQIFKIRHRDELDSFEKVQLLIDETFIQQVKDRFQSMHDQALTSIYTVKENEDNKLDYPEIV